MTDNQEEAMNVGDRIIIMRDGHILQEDDPESALQLSQFLVCRKFLRRDEYLRRIYFPSRKQ